MKKDLYDSALALATVAHKGQVDHSGAPYIEHPIRVARQLRSDDLKIVALLHDTVERSDVTLAHIEAEFGAEVAADVDALSRRKDAGESYESYIERAGSRPNARLVKIADLRDNRDALSMKPDISDKERKKIEKYRKALRALDADESEE